MKLNALLQKIQFNAHSNILWILWLIAMITFATSALVYSYHWRNYGTNQKIMNRVQTLYLTGGILLLLASAILIKFQ